MGTAVDIALHSLAPPDHEAGKLEFALKEPEPPGAGVGELGKFAEPCSGPWPGRVQANPPMVTRQGRTVEVSNRPAAL